MSIDKQSARENEDSVEETIEGEEVVKHVAQAKLDKTTKKRDSLRFYKTGEAGLVTRTSRNLVAGLLWVIYTLVLLYRKLDVKYPTVMEFIRFWMVSNVVTVFQFVAMPVFKSIFSRTELIHTNFQVMQMGTEFSGAPYYIFNYAAGPLTEGGGGGLAYFLAVQITLFLAQVIGFPLQRNVAFKSDGNPWYQAMWYLIAYVAITLFAGAAQGLYKAPLYNFTINTLSLGTFGETVADVISMFIYAIISFWIFYPIFKIIFKKEGGQASV